MLIMLCISIVNYEGCREQRNKSFKGKKRMGTFEGIEEKNSYMECKSFAQKRKKRGLQKNFFSLQ